MVITEVTPAVEILTGSQHELTIKRVLHKVRTHLKGTQKRDVLCGEYETDGLLGQVNPFKVYLCLPCLTYAFLKDGAYNNHFDVFIKNRISSRFVFMCTF